VTTKHYTAWYECADGTQRDEPIAATTTRGAYERARMNAGSGEILRGVTEDDAVTLSIADAFTPPDPFSRKV
jgi:hypothetical protein